MEKRLDEVGFDTLTEHVKQLTERMSKELGCDFMFREECTMPEYGSGGTPDEDAYIREADCCMKTVAGGQELYMRVFTLSGLYEEWAAGRPTQDILEEVRLRLIRCRKVEKNPLFENITDYEKISSFLIIRPLNFTRNRDRLEAGLYETIGDIALALYFDMGTVDTYYASSMVPAEMLKLWKQEWNDVYRDALENTASLYPVKYMRNCTGVLMSVKSNCNGAVSIFLPGVAKKMGQLLKNDYYLAFTSVHEVTIHDCTKVEEESIRSAMAGAGKLYPPGEDYLTDQVFIYDRKRDQIRPCHSHQD